MNIYVISDTHGVYDFDTIRNWKPTTTNNLLIHCGDFGGLFQPTFKANWKVLNHWARQMKEKDFELLVIPGNHENYDLINKLPIVDVSTENYEFTARKLKIINPYTKQEVGTVYYLLPGEFRVGEYRCLAIRGAESIDKEMRQEHITWWKDELLSYSEEQHIVDVIQKNNEFDYIISHTGPSTVCSMIVRKPVSSPVANFLDFVLQQVKFKHWYFGHLHFDVEVGKFTCLYKKVLPLG